MRRVMRCAAVTWFIGSLGLAAPLPAAEAESPRVLFFTRNVGYEHSVVHRDGDRLSLAEEVLTVLGRKAGLEVVCTKDGRVFDDDISGFAAFAFYTNNDLTLPNQRHDPPMTAAGKKRLLTAIADGKGFIGFHSTCNSWPTKGPKNQQHPDAVDPFLAMLGGEFIAHGAQQRATLRLVSPTFPGAKQLGATWALHEEWYSLRHFAPDLHVVLALDPGGMKGPMYQRPTFPATWARRHGQGRVFYTALGHREDVWTNSQFQQLVSGSLDWAAGRIDADITPNMQTCTPEAGKITR